MKFKGLDLQPTKRNKIGMYLPVRKVPGTVRYLPHPLPSHILVHDGPALLDELEGGGNTRHLRLGRRFVGGPQLLTAMAI